jgi:hypothetical protein
MPDESAKCEWGYTRPEVSDLTTMYNIELHQHFDVSHHNMLMGALYLLYSEIVTALLRALVQRMTSTLIDPWVVL